MTRTTATLDNPTPATAADVELARQLAQLARDNEEAERQAQRQRQRDEEEDRRQRQRQRQRDKLVRQRQRRMARRQLADKFVTVGPLLVVNAVTVGGQVAYGYGATPATWDVVARLVVALAYAVAVESVALYVGWHAHDALLLRAYGTARQLRRASYLIAAVVAGLNYSHFAGDRLRPTALAVGCGLLSLLSPWLWGLHSRRASNVRLLAEGLADEAGAEFSSKRWRTFPLRTYLATRWSIEHNERHPGRAWDGYNDDPGAKLSRARRRAAKHRASATLASVKSAGDSVKRPSASDKPAGDSGAGATVHTDMPTRRRQRQAAAGDSDSKARGVELARQGSTAEEIRDAIGCSLRSAQRYVKAAKATPAAA